MCVKQFIDFDLVVTCLGMYSKKKKSKSSTDVHLKMFSTALFIMIHSPSFLPLFAHKPGYWAQRTCTHYHFPWCRSGAHWGVRCSSGAASLRWCSQGGCAVTCRLSQPCPRNSSLCAVTGPSESLAWASVPLPVGTVEPLGSEASDVTPPPRPVLPHVWVNEVQESEQLLSLLSQQSRPARLLCSLSDGQGEPHALDSYMELQIFFSSSTWNTARFFHEHNWPRPQWLPFFSSLSTPSLTREVQPNLTQP